MDEDMRKALGQLRLLVLNRFEPGRPLSCLLTKLDEAELWATRCVQSQ